MENMKVVDFPTIKDSEELEMLKENLLRMAIAAKEISYACKLVYGNDAAIRKIGLSMPYIFASIGSQDAVEHIKRTGVVKK